MEQEKPSFAGEIAQNLKQGAQIAQSVVAEVFPDFPLRLFPQGKGFLQLGLPFWRQFHHLLPGIVRMHANGNKPRPLQQPDIPGRRGLIHAQHLADIRDERPTHTGDPFQQRKLCSPDAHGTQAAILNLRNNTPGFAELHTDADRRSVFLREGLHRNSMYMHENSPFLKSRQSFEKLLRRRIETDFPGKTKLKNGIA